MARISQDDFSGQSDASEGKGLIIEANGQDSIEVPSSDFISNAEMSRSGQDLVFDTADGQHLVIDNYFSAEPTPLIESPDGAILTADLVNSFLNTPMQYAQSATMADESPVGAVEEVNGDASVTRADGTTEVLTLGSPIYQGDVIETSGDGAVNVVFIDETSMAVSSNARLAIDEYQFDPSTESGETNLSVLRGVFVFTSGLIGRDDPDDVMIDTPVGSIGIRGTIIAGNINPGGESEITVVEGAIVVKNGGGERTLAQQFESVKITGFNDHMADSSVKDAGEVNNSYGSVSDVVPRLFSSINDAAKEDSKADAEAKEEAPADDQILQEDQDTDAKSDTSDDQTKMDGQDTLADPMATLQPNQMQPRMQMMQDGNKPIEYKDPSYAGPMSKGPAGETPLYYNVGNRGDNAPFHFTGYQLDKTAQAGDPVANIWFGNAPAGTTFEFTNGTNMNSTGYFQITVSGVNAQVLLTSAGAAAISPGGINSALGSDFVVKAVLPGGQTLGTWTVDGTIHDVAINIDANGDIHHGNLLNAVAAGVSAPNTTAIGNFNGAGGTDYATLNGSNQLHIETTVNGTSTSFGTDTSNTYSSVTGVGDLNNDGYDDVIASAPSVGAGTTTLYKGGASLIAQTPTAGSTPGDQYGHAVAGLGDFDGDGKTDYAVSAINAAGGAGKVYIDSLSSPVITGQGTEGFGQTLVGLGDIDGDGYSDLLVTPNISEQKAYIVYGNTNPTSSASLDTVSGGQNIVATGAAGDINGDGFDDFAVSLDNGVNIDTYVIYGKATRGSYNLSDLENPDYALKIHHDGASGQNYQITSRGDIDGDGFDDLQVGIDGGTQYVVYGATGGDNVPYARDNTATDSNSTANYLAASGNGQSLVGDYNDNLSDGTFDNVRMQGGGGNNQFNIEDANFKNIDGGNGTDTIRFSTSGGTLDFSNINFEQISQIEQIEFTQASQTIQLTTENIFNLLKSSDDGTLKITLGSHQGTAATNGTLSIITDGDDSISTTVQDALMHGNPDASIGAPTSSLGYNVYDIGGYHLYIDQALTTQVV